MTVPGRGGSQPIPRPDAWKPGGPPTWHGLTASDLLDTATAFERIATYSPSELVRGPAVDRPASPGRRSAVLVALFPGEAGLTTLLTKRAAHLRKHAGEISFPGGAVDDTDESLWHTATREAHEEIALPPASVERLGMLDRFVTGASYSMVQPIVGRLDGRPDVVASPDEVASVIETPLGELVAPGVYRQEIWPFGGAEFAMHFFDLVGETVWGATALMLDNLLNVIAGAEPNPDD